MNNRRAIVIGGSVAGLLAARVLSDIFREVVIFERDHFPDGPVHRKGVPQSRHVHVLLARGLEVLEELFPGLSEELIELGAPVSKPEQLLYWIGGGYFCNSAYPHRSITCSRPLLETVIRSRVLACPRVRASDGTPVVALATSGHSARVSGVRLATGQSGVLGDLVVDATGRGSHASAWIQAMGYPTPREERVKAGMGYSSRHYRREPDQLGGKHFLALGATPTCRRGAVVSAQEGDRWIVTLAGYAGDHPPTDDAGFVAFAARLAAPDVHELISHAEPIDNPVPGRYSASQRRHYEELSRFPQGLLVFGDAFCNFNPVYGQGMTVAALQALALRETLATGIEHLAPRFFGRAGKILDAPWTLATGSDRQILEPQTSRPVLTRALEWYLSRLHVEARIDPVAATAFIRVIGLADPPHAILRPNVIARVLRGNLSWPRLRAPEELRRPGHKEARSSMALTESDRVT